MILHTPTPPSVEVGLLEMYSTRNTSLMNGISTDEVTATGISTIAETWIHLSYAVQDGERNRVRNMRHADEDVRTAPPTGSAKTGPPKNGAARVS